MRNRKHDFLKTLISKRPYDTFCGFFRVAALLRMQGEQQKHEKFDAKSHAKLYIRFGSDFGLILGSFWDDFGAKSVKNRVLDCDFESR